MRYDEIFAKPIEEYTDQEIRDRAMEMRVNAKLTRGKSKTKKKSDETSAELAETKAPTNKTANMLEQMINNAKLKKEGEAKDA
jgi:hypothetical protein